VESEEYLFARFSVQVQENGLVARFFGEPVDRTRHQLSREVKAITYHELKVEPLPSGWRAEVIVDI
jgi:SHS2 domain-containing protein